VDRVGNQGHRVCQHAGRGLGDDESEIDRCRDREGAVMPSGAVVMAVGVPVGMPVGMPVAVVVPVVMIMRHALGYRMGRA
jgi:hypothetical protein